MTTRLQFPCICLLVAIVNAGPRGSPAHADSSQTKSVRLHASSPPVPVRFQTSDQGVALTAQGTVLEVPLQGPVSIAVQSVKLTSQSDRYVGIVRVTSSTATYVALLVAPNYVAKWLWSGRADLHGDPGERTRHVVEVTKQGDNARVFVKEQREGVRICGQPLAALNLRHLDPATLALERLTLPRLPQQMLDKAIDLETLDRRPEFVTEAPRVHLLERNAAVQYPTDFVSMHNQSVQWPVEALQLELGSRPPAEVELFLVGDSGQVFKVRLLSSPKQTEHWIVFKPPLQWRCMSLVQANSALDLSSVSVRAITALDRHDGLDRLLRAWRSGRQPADEATSLLKRWGPDAVSALLGLWPKLNVPYRRSAVEIWANYTAKHPLAIEALADAARDPNVKVRKAAIDGLIAAKEPAVEHLSKLSQVASAQGDRVALWLSEHYPEQALSSLLKAFELHGGENRVALRTALDRALSRVQIQVAERALATWYTANPRVGARAAVIAVLGTLAAHQDRAQEWLQATYPDTQHFADQWRLVQASMVLPADVAIDRWLTELALNAKAWMLRAAAWRALTLRHPDASALPVTRALSDDYPVVRQQAIQILIRQHNLSAWRQVQSRLDDRSEWPMVKHAALDFVSDRCVSQGAKSVLATLREQTASPASHMSNRLAWHAFTVAATLSPQTRQQALELLAQGRFRRWAAKAAKAKADFCQTPGNL